MYLIFTFMNKLFTNYNYISLLFIRVDRESMHKKLHIVLSCLTFFSILRHEIDLKTCLPFINQMST